MNNDAFKDLVRSKVKSTKQIAREAVEEAFQKKRKKRKGRGGGDDDDLSSSESESESRSNKKRHKDDHLQPTSVRKRGRKGGDEEGGSNSMYRDRAKERREGKNTDYKASQKMMETVAQGEDGEASLNQNEISKYLGGDEAHTHLVKGLDVALARSVRNEMSKQGEQIAEDEEEESENQQISSMEEAWEYIQNQLDSDASHSALGRRMLQFHRGKRKPQSSTQIAVSAAGSAMQRTQLSFSVDWHPRNLALSWEVPCEKSQAAAMAAQATRLPKASPLPSDLIQQIMQSESHKQRLVIHSPDGKTTANESAAAKPQTTVESEDSEDDIFPDAKD